MEQTSHVFQRRAFSQQILEMTPDIGTSILGKSEERVETGLLKSCLSLSIEVNQVALFDKGVHIQHFITDGHSDLSFAGLALEDSERNVLNGERVGLAIIDETFG